MNKLIISLSPQDVQLLAAILELILTGSDMNELKKSRLNDYLMFSCVYDLFNRLDAKKKEIDAFGYTPKKPVKISLKRYEALAFFILFDNKLIDYNESYLPDVPESSIMMIRGIRAEIHKFYLV